LGVIIKKTTESPNEILRKQAIEEYQLLGTERDPNLDEITLLACELLEVPSCMISIFDKERQWFKSKVGIDINETPRDISFSKYAIDATDVFVIENSRTDERFKNNPFTISGEVLFYAGMPLINPKGIRFGTLCVIDHTPRQMSEHQKGIMRLLAKQVTNHLELKKNNELLIKSMNELVAAEKMQSLGQMAGGMAHEINNPLTIIRTKISLLKIKLDRGEIQSTEQYSQFLDDLDNSAYRIEKIVKSLLYFSRGIRPELTENLNSEQIYEACLPHIAEKIDDIKFTFINNSKNAYFSGNKEQIVQVMLNLINNSIDAMTNSVEKKLFLESYVKNDHFIFRLTDTGQGIEQNIQKKIMEPFFTTKDVGKGQGLGLSLSRGIIQNHGGTLELIETSSVGTSFQITFPVVKEN